MGQHQEEQRSEASEGEAPAALANYHVRGPHKGRLPAAQKQFELFLREYNQRLRNDGATPLVIAIWGAGVDVESPVAEKRWEIKEALEARGHAAFFSEEIEEAEDIRDQFQKDEGLLLKALRQAQGADFLIVLVGERSVGVVTELQLCSLPEVAAKVFVLVPKILEESFLRATIAQIKTANGAVLGYTSDELEESYVLSAAIDRVDAKRLQVALRRAGVFV